MPSPQPATSAIDPRRSEAFRQAASVLRLWREYPALFVEQELGATPQEWQYGVLEAFAVEQRIAMAACVGPGKSAVLAWLILNFMVTRDHPNVVVTSITGDNLRDNLWKELSKWGHRSELVRTTFDFQTERIVHREAPRTWFAAARKWTKQQSEEEQEHTLGGFHADHLLFVLDEAGGIPDTVARTAERALSTADQETKLVLAGNPTHLEGPLYRAFHDSSARWRKFQIGGGPDDPDRAPRVSEDWAREMRDDWGEDSALYQINVLGRFPTGATDALVTYADLEASYGRVESKMGARLQRGVRRLGADVARYGNDWTRVCKRDGDFLLGFVGWHNKSTTETAYLLAKLRKDEGFDEIEVDDTGVGGGVTDKLLELNEPVVPFVSAEKAREEEQYFNARSEAAGILRERFRKGTISVAPAVKQTTPFAGQATTIKVGYDGKRRMKLERKDEYRKRKKGRSPDFLDATLLAFDEETAGVGASGEEMESSRGTLAREIGATAAGREPDSRDGEWVSTRRSIRLR